MLRCSLAGPPLPPLDSDLAPRFPRYVPPLRFASNGRLRAPDSLLHAACCRSLSWRISKHGLSGRWTTLCFSRRKPTQAAEDVRVLNNADLRQTGEMASKVTRTVLCVAIACNLVLRVWSRPAAACVQVGLPGGSSAAAVCKKLLGTELLSSAWMGLVAGCLHTLTGPDHLAALAPLSIGRTKLESVGVGALWGCGHDAGQLIFGILFLLLKDKLHLEIIRTWGARVVAMTLLTIGVLGIKEAEEIAIPCIAGDGSSLSSTFSPPESFKGAKKKIGFATFATGVVHGLQPDALLMILPAVTFASRLQGAAFLGMFLLGTVLSMSSYTAFIGSCSHALRNRVPTITKHLSWGSSLIAILVGVAIFAGELFGLTVF